ncbi:MAG: hypothetical protein ACRDTT_07910 [Pseudonocardiaceae bacterium]
MQQRVHREVTGINPLRARSRVRDMLSRELLTSADLVAPVLVQPARRPAHEHTQLSGSVPVDRLAEHVEQLHQAGVRAIKLFCYVEDKSPDASAALRTDNLLVTGVGIVRSTVPDMVIATEVCGCAWTDHGECVLLDGRGRTDRDATYTLMAEMAQLHAQAGADVIGPAAVLDGSVNAIRAALDDEGFPDVSTTPSVIFDSVLFAPYKQAMNTDPGRGNRRGFQLDACHAGQALDLAHRWLDEGADSLLVQPAMMIVDVLTRLRNTTRVPITAFSVSGEDRLLQDSPDSLYLEYARALKRAGADLVLTYGALRLATALQAAGATK